MTPFLNPQRHRRIETGGTCRVVIHVGGDFQSRIPRRLNQIKNIRHFVPVLFTGGLQVVNLRRGAGDAGYLDQFLHAFFEAVSLRANMRNVAAAIFRGDADQGDQFFRVGEIARCVDE